MRASSLLRTMRLITLLLTLAQASQLALPLQARPLPAAPQQSLVQAARAPSVELQSSVPVIAQAAEFHTNHLYLPLIRTSHPGVTEAIITPVGGTLRSPDGRVTVTVPAGAVEGPVRFVYTLQPTEHRSSYRFSLEALDTHSSTEVGIFQAPIELAIQVEAESSRSLSSLAAESHQLYQQVDGTWVALPITLSRDLTTLSAQVSQPGLFELLTITPSQAAPNIIIDELDTAAFQHGNKANNQWASILCGVNSCWKDHAFWTYNRSDYNPNCCATPWDWATWTPSLSQVGYYAVYAYIPASPLADTRGARYEIAHNGKVDFVFINQRFARGSWAYLGGYWFNGDGNENIYLDDIVPEQVNPDEGTPATIAFDAVGLTYFGNQVPPPPNQPPTISLIEPWSDGHGNFSVKVAVTDDAPIPNGNVIFLDVSAGSYTTQLQPWPSSGPNIWAGVIRNIPPNVKVQFNVQVTDAGGLSARVNEKGEVTYSVPHSSSFGAWCDPQCFAGNPVNTATGNDTDLSIDLAIPGPGDSAIIIDRSYNSQDERDGPFGRGSSFTYSMTLTVHDNPLLQGVQITYGDGHTANFRQNGASYEPVSPGNFDRVERNGSDFILHLKDRSSFVFDSSGRLIETRTRNGVPITLVYNGAGKIGRIADQTGRGITLHWDGNHIIQIDAPESKFLYYKYEGAKLKSFTDGRGKTTTFEHDSADRITAVITPNGYPRLRQELDERGRVLWQIIGEHERLDFGYDDAARTTKVSAVDGTTTYIYDPNYFIQKIIDKHGKDASFVHDSRGNLRQLTDRRGNIWSYDYDPNGNRIEQIDPVAACAAAPYTSDVTRWRYDGFSQVISKTDSLGATWIYTYSLQGDLTKILEPNGALTELAYDHLGQTLVITDANRHATGFRYDQHGNQVRVIDANTRVLTATFDLLGRVTSRSDANNHTTSFRYDGADNILQIRDPREHSWMFGYDDNGNLTTLTDRRGVIRSFAYDRSDNLKQEWAYPGALPVVYGYDTRNRLVSITDQLGYTRTYSYDTLDRLMAENDRANAIFRYEYDPNGNRTLQVDPFGVRMSYEYDKVNRLVLETDTIDSQVVSCYDSEDRLIRSDGPRSGEIYQFSYDPLGRPTGLTDPQGNTWTSRYDLVGNLVAATDPLDHRTDYSYDPLNRLEALLRPALPDGSRSTTRYAYDAAGNLARLTSPRGFDSVFTYDENDNLLSFRDGAGATSSTTYDEEDNPLVSSDAKGNPTTVSYGPNGLPRTIIDARGFITRLAYDPVDNLIRVDDALNRPTRYAYDPEQRLVGETDPLSHQTIYRRDLLGRITGVDDANGHRTSYSYDILGRLIRVTDGNGSPTHYAYDVADNLIGITDANGNTTTFRYSLLNQLLAEENPLGRRWSYAYDPAGRMIRRVDGMNRPTSYAFDSNDRLIGVQYGAPASEQAPLIFQYDADGNQTAACNDLGCVSTSYDAVGRPTTTNDVFGRALRRGYDAVGNPLAMIYPDGRQLRYAYDMTNQLIGVTLPGDRDSLFQRDALGRVTQVIHPNGLRSSYAYDEAGRLTSLDHRLAGAATPISAYAYTLDGVGNRIAVRETRAAFDGSKHTASLDHRYSYDKADRLVESATAMSVGGTPTDDGTTNYRFDAAGNRLARDGSLLAPDPGLPALPVAARPEATSYSYNTANQLVGAGAASLSYDGNGNRVHEQRHLADGRLETIDYRYDRENRLVGVTKAVGGTATMEAGYEYDAYGRRARKTVRWPGKPGAVTTFLYDGLDIIGAKLEAGGKTSEVYYYLAPSPLTGMRRPLAAQDLGSGATDWYLLDGLDSVAGMTDERGRLDAPALYDDYGRLLAGDPAAALFTYTGQDYDAETGLLHFYARYYDAERGVWLTQDAYRGVIYNLMSLHRYMYNYDNPTNYIDRDGRQPLLLAAAIYVVGAAVIGGGISYTSQVMQNIQRDGWQLRSLVNIDKQKIVNSAIEASLALVNLAAKLRPVQAPNRDGGQGDTHQLNEDFNKEKPWLYAEAAMQVFGPKVLEKGIKKVIQVCEPYIGGLLGKVKPKLPTTIPGFGTVPFGREMEKKLPDFLRKKYPRTQFEFNTAPGQTGPDIIYKGGEYPGFDIGDLKPNTASGSNKFLDQTGNWGANGWKGGPEKWSGRAALFEYDANGAINDNSTIWVVE